VTIVGGTGSADGRDRDDTPRLPYLCLLTEQERGSAMQRPSTTPLKSSPRRRPRRLSRSYTTPLVVTGCFVVLVVMCLVLAAQPISGTPTRVGPSRTDEKFPTVDVVSGTPVDWVAAICAPRTPFVKAPIDPFNVSGDLRLSPSVGLSLPGSTFHASCIAKDRTASDPLLLVAQYPSEDPLQHDLARNGFQWYCFAAVRGRLFVTATRAKEQVMDSAWSVSPVLQPLARFGFNIYANPGH
jgi:hypothetical protein